VCRRQRDFCNQCDYQLVVHPFFQVQFPPPPPTAGTQPVPLSREGYAYPQGLPLPGLNSVATLRNPTQVEPGLKLGAATFASLAFAMALGPGCRLSEEPKTDPTPTITPAGEDPVVAVIDQALRQRSTVPDPAVASCASCHIEETRQWRASQHARANRLTSAKADQAAFDPARTLEHGSTATTTRWRDGHPEFESVGPEGASVHRAEAAIGIEPLVQYLVPFPGGRLQVVDVSHDPHRDVWFNAFGDDDRQPHEWGHWQNRSMSWNSRCAFCHVTNFEKNYDLVTDSYHSTWDAMGVSCAQCHQIDDTHGSNAHPECPVAPDKIVASPQRITANCASCHSRREELTGGFTPGDAFHDHFHLTLLSQPGVYYEDGQVREENFEYGSVISSRMHHAGVTCLDCHNPHSGELIMPVENNALCLSCHTPPGNRDATPIHPLTHSHHPVGSTGAQCVNCHMPETVYMQNDPRRDHGFTRPDPQLTLELGIPNACNRCHVEKNAAWAADWTRKWYGEDYNGEARRRARLLRRAAEGDTSAGPELLAETAAQEIPMWRASLLAVLAPWAHERETALFLTSELTHEDPLVRATAVRVLSSTGTADSLIGLRRDPSRLVRLEAAWSNPAGTDLSFELAAEQEHWLAFNSDQPIGALRRAQQALARQDIAAAEHWARRAVAWDPAALSHHLLGRVLFANGKSNEATEAIRRAVALDPANADYPFELALLLSELGDPTGAITQLNVTVERAPQFGRAWYNLGLAYAGQEQLPEALAALTTAEELMPNSAEVPYAMATIHFRLDDRSKALAAAERAFAIAPDDRRLSAFVERLRDDGDTRP